MYNLSNDAKAALKSKAVITTARITLTSDNTVIDGNNLKEITITDQCYQDGVIIGTAMCKEVEIEIIDNNYDLANQEFSLEVGVLLPNNTYEYIPYGNFIVKEYQKIVSSNSYKIIAYDYMDKFNPMFIDNNPTVQDSSTYVTPMTLQEFYQYVANQYNVTIEEQLDLPNATFSITEKPYFDGMSGRIVLSRIAEMMGCFAKINRNNRLEMRLKNTTNEQFSRDEMNNSLEIDNRFGPINVVSLRLSQVEGENATRRDEDSIAEYGETVLQISDNPFAYTEALRFAAVDDIYNFVDGFSYYPTTFNGKLIYLDCGDEVEVQDMSTDNYYKTIILKQVLKIPATRASRFENNALTKTGLEYQFTSEQKQINKRTEYLVDKQNQKISQIIEQQEEQSSQLELMETTIDGIKNTLQKTGGNNLFYYSTEYWQGENVPSFKRNIQVGDDLSGKTLYLNFPTEEPLDVIEIATNSIITCTNGAIVHEGIEDTSDPENPTSFERVSVTQETVEIDRIYNMRNGSYISGETEYVLPDDFGRVTSIDEDSEIYQYIQIEIPETLLPVNLAEYTDTEFKNNTVSGRGYIVNEGYSIQDTMVTKTAVPNGTYTVSFKYKKIGPNLSNASVKINGEEILLTETNWTDVAHVIEVTTNHITVEFISDTDNSLYVADLMGNPGTEASIWTQHPNETITDTVTIGEGITVQNSETNTYTKIDADGNRTYNAQTGEVVAEMTDKGANVKELIVREKAQIAGLLIQQVGNQTWISSLL